MNSQYNKQKKATIGLEEFDPLLASPWQSLVPLRKGLEIEEPKETKPEQHSCIPQANDTTNAWRGGAPGATKPKAVGLAAIQAEQEQKKKQEQRPQAAAREGGGKYIPPAKRGVWDKPPTSTPWSHAREGPRARPPVTNTPFGSPGSPEGNPTIRLGGLPEAATEADVADLCGRLGRLSRVHLVKDKETGQSRGFAFVTFGNSQEAEQAKEKLNGHRYDYRILWADRARSRTNEPPIRRTGYGQALPQTRRPGYGQALRQAMK